MTAVARIRQADVTRLMKAARAAGYDRVRVGLDEHGNPVVDASNAPLPELPAERRNPLDRLLEGR